MLILVPLLLVFVPLLTAADALFSKAVSDLVVGINLPDLAGRTTVVLVLAWLLAGLLGLVAGTGDGGPLFQIRTPAGAVGDYHQAVPGSGGWRPLRIGETMFVMVVLDALLLAFVVFQLRYLFLSEEALGYDLQSIPYADYAREGFFQLLTVAVLTGVVVFLLEVLTRRDTPLARLAFNLAASIMIACTLVMLVSSFRRLALYEL